MIEPILGDCTREGVFFAHYALQEPESWPSRRAAHTLTPRSPLLLWDQRVLEAWFGFGLKDGPNGSVVLTTPKEQEAVTYVRPTFDTVATGNSGTWSERQHKEYPDWDAEVDSGRNFYCPAASITMARLPEVRPRTLYIFGGKSVMSPLLKREMIMETTGTGAGGSGGCASGMLQSKVLENSGHLLTFENPRDCAKVISQYIRHLQGMAQQERPTVGRSLDPNTGQLFDEWQAQAARQVQDMSSAKQIPKL